ncbi:MAG: arylsulfatase [Verrucomicrobiaceae bacterium]|nr:arylsulfatase [Verrucomicrobiaceae bacterium]
MKPFLFLLALSTSILAADKPNIIYFLIDDLGYADCGFNGGQDIRTPNIDKLAKEGAVLKSYYVQPVCSPTRSALMTGRYATHTGVYNVVRPGAPWGLPLAERLLPQALKEVGYTTAITGKWHLGEFQSDYTPTRRGFDHQYGHYFGALDYFTHDRDGKMDWYRNDKPLVEEGYTTHLVAREATRLIREQANGKPLFLYVPFNGIHSPHQVPDSYTEPYKHLPKLRQSIAGMLSAVDEAIGQITAALTEKGLRENTLIIFSSDNGGPGPGSATMNTPLRAGKGTLYEGGIRVCSFATWPGKIPAGITIDEPMHAVDWYPTLVKLTGAPAAQALAPDGLDIWPVLTQGAKSPHDALLLPGMAPDKMALRMGDWKLLLNASDKDAEEAKGSDKAIGKMELYNLANDIAEKNNLAKTQPEKLAGMRARLDALLLDAVPAGGPSEIAPTKKGKKGKGKK